MQQQAAGPTDSGAAHALPGVLLHCAMLTVLIVALAAATGSTGTESLLRPLFFALLYSFVHTTGRRHRNIRGLPLRLIESGFLVLMLGSVAAAAMAWCGVDLGDSLWSQVRLALGHGTILLLGMALVAYGLMLWIPLVLESHRKLEDSYAKTRGELQVSESVRARMEQRLVDSHRLTMLGELAAGVGHDLRNPLTIVKGAAEALARRARSPEAVAEHVDIIRRGVDKADHTIRALIDLGRPRRATTGPVRLAGLATEVVDLVLAEGRRRQLRYVAEVGDFTVMADRELLAQALINMLLNATQASSERGVVALRAHAFTIGRHRMVAIAVEDRGKGLPPEVRRQLFTPFFTTRTGGTGLGLLSCRRIAMEMGGRFGLFPRRHGGARAVLLLPAATGELPVVSVTTGASTGAVTAEGRT